MSEASQSGKAFPALASGLYVVGTPIGNLEDMTLRAVRVLKGVDVIACEDTRHTQKLLNHYAIEARTVSYHEHNEAERAAELVGRMERGGRVALVTDAGMPGISDPGYRLVRLAVERNLLVVPVPGPAALILGLAASGLATDAFGFGGFLPAKTTQRRQTLEAVQQSQRTEIFYEAPHRLVEALQDLVEVLGNNRPVVIARELTKLHEEFIRGSAGEVLDRLRQQELKGEVTLLIGKAIPSEAVKVTHISVGERVQQMMAQDGLTEKEALKKTAKERGISKSEAYRELQRARG
jgi:16S rRNA (cytidine1402-2'-O)-methyltransferase